MDGENGRTDAPRPTVVTPSGKAPALPVEMYRMITQLTDRKDLSNFRLVSRAFADIGAKELFGTITFKYSWAKIEQIMNIKACGHLRRCVKTIVWNSNLWYIPTIDDWGGCIRHIDQREMALASEPTITQETQYGDGVLDDIRESYHKYRKYQFLCLEEESVSQYLEEDIFDAFENLRKISILDGALNRSHWGIEKKSDDVPLHPTKYAIYHGEGLYMGSNYALRR